MTANSKKVITNTKEKNINITTNIKKSYYY